MISGQTFYDGCQVPSLIFSGCLAHLLSSDVSQVVVFIVGFMISPHHKNNLKPLGSQSSKGLRMAVSFAPLVAIIFVRPLTSIERVKRKPVRGVRSILITGKTKLYDMTFATGFGYRHSSRLGLKVTKRLPATLGITELSPKLGHGGPAFSSRQRLNKLSCRHRGEKTFDLLAVVFHRFSKASS